MNIIYLLINFNKIFEDIYKMPYILDWIFIYIILGKYLILKDVLINVND